MNAILLRHHLCSVTGTTISVQTVGNRLHAVGLYARQPMVCVSLTASLHRTYREWATEHADCRRNEWGNIFLCMSHVFLFTLMIGVFLSGGNVNNPRNNPALSRESIRFGDGRVMVYAGISSDGRKDLHII